MSIISDMFFSFNFFILWNILFMLFKNILFSVTIRCNNDYFKNFGIIVRPKNNKINGEI